MCKFKAKLLRMFCSGEVCAELLFERFSEHYLIYSPWSVNLKWIIVLNHSVDHHSYGFGRQLEMDCMKSKKQTIEEVTYVGFVTEVQAL